jgi:hypothetical protein
LHTTCVVVRDIRQMRRDLCCRNDVPIGHTVVHKDTLKDRAILKGEGSRPVLLVRLRMHVAAWSVLVRRGRWPRTFAACGGRWGACMLGSGGKSSPKRRRTCHMPLYDEPFA